MLWSDEDLSWLRGSDSGDYEQLKKERLQADYDLIRETVPSLAEELSFRQFQELFKTTSTRAYAGWDGGVNLVPFADMGNHNHEADVIWTFVNPEG